MRDEIVYGGPKNDVFDIVTGGGKVGELPQHIDFKRRDAQGYSLLHLAARGGDSDMLDSLLQRADLENGKSNIDLRGTIDSMTPLHVACESPHDRSKVIKYLLENGADINKKDADGNTPFGLVWSGMQRKNRLALLQTPWTWRKTGTTAPPNGTELANDTMADDNVDFSINPYIRSGADVFQPNVIDVTIKTGLGYSPLHLAIIDQDFQFLKLLVNSHIRNKRHINVAHINVAADRTLNTPLHLAAKSAARKRKHILFLIRNGADVENTNKEGKTPQELADQTSTENGETFSKLLQDVNFYRAVHRNQGNKVVQLLKQGASVNATMDDGNTPLHLAVAMNHVQQVKILLGAGAHVNATLNGVTPLHLAVVTNRVQIIDILLEEGANVNATLNGVTLLRLAKNNEEIVKILSQAASVSLGDNHSQPLPPPSQT